MPTITTDEMNRMMIDIMAGRPGPANEPPHKKNMRRVLKKEIREMEERGVIVDIPPELPEA